METFGERLAFARRQKGMTQDDVAARFHINRVNISQWESNTTNPETPRIPALAEMLETTVDWLLSGTGTPPAKQPKRKKETLVSSYDPDKVERDSDPDWDGTGAGVIDGRLSYSPKLPGGMPETAASPGMGLGRIDDGRAARLVTGGIATGHPVLNEWVIPPSYVRNALDASPSQVMIMPVIGHSMEPMLKANDRVLVDISQNAWVGDAVYVIDDGDTVLRAKTVKKVTASTPPQYRIVSEAAPEEVEILNADQFKIVGRVVGRFTRM
ncbi:helix-turn-helix domain-containing protein [Shinella kummerowiae]|uniref:Helix-turn-helix domain-containing protein n=1 Tax=Shinella kummerowiae TaxID=417745 RepID=A0A6N8SCA5_9HYPH|nr:helix-turn-helix domain-containing protein [Shinella kummerowiae]MXN46087.1 helix-turn-helix domain-containing protein [Shinella kummerowiae]